MVVISVQIAPWGKPYEISQMRGGRPLTRDQFKIGDKVIIKAELGSDLGEIVKIEEKGDVSEKEKSEFIVRKASAEDLKRYKEKNKGKKQAIAQCEELVKKRNLPVKIVDVLFSFDGGRVTFLFTAPRKVDFRQLVKDLASLLHKSIRMYQIGVRQETGLAGDIGPCGRPLCCLAFLKELGKVTTDLIFDQQLSQRGPERLTGVCGRLKCCLAYEEEQYKELVKNLPSIGTIVKTEKGEGKVVDRHILTQTVMVETKDNVRMEVPVTEIVTPNE